MADDIVVKKDNALVRAAYTLSLAEHRLILLAVADAAGKPDMLKDMTVYAEQYADRFKVTRQAAYMALGEASRQLFERRFSYDRLSSKGRPRKVVSRWIQRIEYGESEGLVKLRFADDVIPLLTDLQRRFTYYSLGQVAGLTSTYAVRLYELLIAWRSTGKTPVFEVADFRQHLGIEPDEYPRMTDFKRRALDVAIKQVNEHTDITAEYEQHKRGRTITGFSFTFTLKNPGRDPNTIDLLTGATDAERARPKRKRITRAEAEGMAKPGEEWGELLKRLSSEFFVTGMN
ncbi:MAG: replication initiation protein RepM [Porticoccaceae bacterium]